MELKYFLSFKDLHNGDHITGYRYDGQVEKVAADGTSYMKKQIKYISDAERRLYEQSENLKVEFLDADKNDKKEIERIATDLEAIRGSMGLRYNPYLKQELLKLKKELENQDELEK